LKEVQPQEVRCIIDWGSFRDMMKKERHGYVPKRCNQSDATDEVIVSHTQNALGPSRSVLETSSVNKTNQSANNETDSDASISLEGPEHDSISEIYQSFEWNSASSRRQLRLLMLRDGASAGDIIELLAPAAARKRGERWFMEVLDGEILDKMTDEPLISSCRWWINWLPGQFTGPDAAVKDSQPQEVRCIIDWGSAKDMMKKERHGYVPKRGGVLAGAPESDRARAFKRNISETTPSSSKDLIQTPKQRRTSIEAESDGEDSGDDSDNSANPSEDSKYNSLEEIHRACPWNSASSRRQLRLLMLRDGASAGDMIELLAPAAARKRGERWFMEVMDGTILDKTSDEPKISSCRWWRNWMPGMIIQRDMTLKEVQPQEVRCIIDWGSFRDMMKKERHGYVPKRGITICSPDESKPVKKQGESPLKLVFFSSFLENFLFVFTEVIPHPRIRERILLQGFVDNGHVLEVLPPSGQPQVVVFFTSVAYAVQMPRIRVSVGLCKLWMEQSRIMDRLEQELLLARFAH
jgi:hypothetical protein